MRRAVLASVAVLLVGCSRDGPPIEMTIPKGFTGPIWIMLDESAPLHQALNFLRRDLQGALPPAGIYALAGDFKDEQIGGGIGQNFRLQFFTSTGIINENAPWGEIQEVSYELRDPLTRTGGTGRELIRSVYRNLLGTTTQ